METVSSMNSGEMLTHSSSDKENVGVMMASSDSCVSPEVLCGIDVLNEFFLQDSGLSSPIEFCCEPNSRSLGNLNHRDLLIIGKKPTNPSVTEYADFMDPCTLEKILLGKKIFDHFDLAELERARSRGNPYELIGSCIFMNRAAMKLAEIDACFDWSISSPLCWDPDGTDPMFFGDLCGGHGGFSEYILWRRGWRAKGFAITLKGKDDIKPDYIISGHREMVKCFYGFDGDGDITKVRNVLSFFEEVLAGTNGSLLHSVVSDGGFSVAGNENEQEILTRELYFYQVLCALMVLRKGGNFVCKLFDVSTSFTASLLYLVHKVFKRICLYKPLTSRPANGERYLVCLDREEDFVIKPVIEYMLNVAETVSHCLRSEQEDIKSLVPIEMIDKEVKFVDYLRRIIEWMAQRQIFYLAKLRRFAEDTTLTTPSQDQIRKMLLRKWKIPNRSRNIRQPQCHPAEIFKHIIQYLGPRFISLSPVYRPPKLFSDHFAMTHFLPQRRNVKYIVSMGTLEFIVGCGGSRVYSKHIRGYKQEFASSKADNWKIIQGGLVLPKGTFLLAEKVEEVMHTKNGFTRNISHYVLDAFLVGGEMLLSNNRQFSNMKDYLYRHKQTQILLNALHSPSLKLYRLLSWDKASIVVDACSAEIQNMIRIGAGLYAPFNGFRTIAGDE